MKFREAIIRTSPKTLEHAKVHLLAPGDEWSALRFSCQHLKAQQNASHGIVFIPTCSKVLLHMAQFPTGMH